MPAQQKPKRERGNRNGDRRNGKSWSSGHNKSANASEKPRKGWYGVSLKTIKARAEAAGVDESVIITHLAAERAARNEYRCRIDPVTRRVLADAIRVKHMRQKLYQNGKGLDVKVDTLSGSGKLRPGK